MTSSAENEPPGKLQDILADAPCTIEFLVALSRLAADAVSHAAGTNIECAVTIKARRRPATVAGSSLRAVELDQMEQTVSDGPCITAMRDMTPVLATDTATEPRWPELMRKFADANIHSSLWVPLQIGSDATAALNFFAPAPDAFTPTVYDKALSFATAARSTLNLSVRIDAAQHRAADLEAAMQSRTAINLACGVIMGQNRCTQEQAMEILTTASSNSNQKLRDVATELITQTLRQQHRNPLRDLNSKGPLWWSAV